MVLVDSRFKILPLVENNMATKLVNQVLDVVAP